jgi:hypothetical protein
MGRGLTLLTELALRDAELSQRLGGSCNRSIVAALDCDVVGRSRGGGGSAAKPKQTYGGGGGGVRAAGREVRKYGSTEVRFGLRRGSRFGSWMPWAGWMLAGASNFGAHAETRRTAEPRRRRKDRKEFEHELTEEGERIWFVWMEFDGPGRRSVVPPGLLHSRSDDSQC